MHCIKTQIDTCIWLYVVFNEKESNRNIAVARSPLGTLPSQTQTFTNNLSSATLPKNTNLQGVETVRVMDMINTSMFTKSIGSIFSTINKSVSSAFSSLMSTQETSVQPGSVDTSAQPNPSHAAGLDLVPTTSHPPSNFLPPQLPVTAAVADPPIEVAATSQASAYGVSRSTEHNAMNQMVDMRHKGIVHYCFYCANMIMIIVVLLMLY